VILRHCGVVLVVHALDRTAVAQLIARVVAFDSRLSAVVAALLADAPADRPSAAAAAGRLAVMGRVSLAALGVGTGPGMMRMCVCVNLCIGLLFSLSIYADIPSP